MFKISVQYIQRLQYFQLKKTVTRVRAVKVTLYVHQNFSFKLTKYGRVNIHKTLRLKTNSKIKVMVGIINKANMKMLAKRDWLQIKILSGRKKEKKTTQSLTNLIQRTLHCNFFVIFWIFCMYQCYVKETFVIFIKLIQIRLVIQINFCYISI